MTTTSLVEAQAAQTSVAVAGFVTIDINGTKYTLTGTVGAAIIVEYHRPFAEAANVGNVQSIVTSVATALGSAQIGNEVSNEITALQAVPFLGPVIKVITTANIRITDLGINTATKTYQFGFGLDLTGQGIALGGIALDSFGLVVTAQG